MERLQESNKELRRKNHHGAQKLHALAEERAELHAQLLESSKTVAGLSKRLGLAQRDNQDLVQFQVFVRTKKMNILISREPREKTRFKDPSKTRRKATKWFLANQGPENQVSVKIQRLKKERFRNSVKIHESK